MLHAFNQKNVRRILPPRRADHVIEKTEDAVTSMVFSSLDFMTATDALRAMRAIVGDEATASIATWTPTGHEVHLWPAGLTAPSVGGDGDTRCEPDLVAVFQFDNGKRAAFIGEMKWDWRMPLDQLRREVEREIHAVSAKWPAQLFPFVIAKHQLPERVGDAPTLTWQDVARRLHPLTQAPVSGSGRWAKQVRRFLDMADIRAFNGFPSHDIESAWLTPVLFRSIRRD